MHKILRFITISFSVIFLLTQISYAATANDTHRNEWLITYSNGTILDTHTKLMWAAKDNGRDLKLQSDAIKYCMNYRGGGYTDWRMPTLAELEGLYWTGKELYLAGKVKHMYLAKNITKMFIWASDTRGSEFARFSFVFGSVIWTDPSMKYYIGRALPVRSSK